MDYPNSYQTSGQFTQSMEDTQDDQNSLQTRDEGKIIAFRSRINQTMNNNDFLHFTRGDEDAFLLLFLRARRYNVEESFKLLCNYIEFRTKNASVCQNLSAWQLHHVIEDGFPCVLPYGNQNGAKMLVIFAGSWDTDTYGTEEILKAFILSMERLIENDDAQLNGIVIIADFSGWTATQASRLSLSFIRKVFAMFQVSLGFIIKARYQERRPACDAKHFACLAGRSIFRVEESFNSVRV